MEAFDLKCQSPVELLVCSRRATAVCKSVSLPHSDSKTRVATLRSCHESLTTTLTSTLASTTTTPIVTATATTTVRTLTTSIPNTSSLSGNNTDIPIPIQIRLRKRRPPTSPPTPRALYQQQRQHFTYIRQNLCSCLHWRHNLTCIMMTMLVLASILLSGNTALAAQRESFKPKDTNHLNNNNNNNANAIYNEISSSSGGSSSNSGDGNSNGNGNAISHSNNNNISNGNTNVTTTTSLSTSTSTSTSSSSAVSGSGYATTTSTHTTSSATSSGGSASSSSGSSSSHKISSSSRNSIELQEQTQNGPYFDKAASKNVTALLGKTAYLNCRVKNLGNKTMLLQVSWVRHRDIHLLTVGRYTYTSDQRFRAIHQPQTEDWILQIKYPQHRDSGIYECQVSTTPHMSHYIHLNVVEPSTEIIGAPDLYIESGSTINLTCVILNSPEPPAYIFWNHNNAIINYDSPRGGVSVVTNKGETTTSFLLIKSARPSDSGHYQCNPSNAKPKSVTVHVLNGVSHSVSRGIPSSNAARGTSTSSNVSKSLYLSVPVNVLVYLSICQALHKATGCSDWSKICGHVIETFLQLLGFMLLTLMAGFVKVLRRNGKIKCNSNVMTVATIAKNNDDDRTNSSNNSNNKKKIQCYYDMQLRENYHMTRTISQSTYKKLATASVVKCTCKRQSFSGYPATVRASVFSTSSASTALSSVTSSTPLSTVLQVFAFVCVIVNVCCYLLLLYSKKCNNLFKNDATSTVIVTATTTALSSPSLSSAPLLSLSTSTSSSTATATMHPLIDDNCSGSSSFSICCPLSIKCFCLQSTATFFSESDIR